MNGGYHLSAFFSRDDSLRDHTDRGDLKNCGLLRLQ